MSDPFVAEIRMFAGNFAPRGWALCNGQIMLISQNTALFSLLGTMYGGDGRSNFALPDLQGRAPLQTGQGPGLSDYAQGEVTGTETVTLLESEMPIHTHTLMGANAPAEQSSPAGNAVARSLGGSIYTNTGAPDTSMAPQTVAPAGGSLPHNNMQPYLTVTFIIALQGIFPPRP